MGLMASEATLTGNPFRTRPFNDEPCVVEPTGLAYCHAMVGAFLPPPEREASDYLRSDIRQKLCAGGRTNLIVDNV